MAVMIPPQLDRTVESGAEHLLYDAFQSGLSEKFTVIHQVGFLLRTSSKGDRTGEIDFVIIHPELGILAIEVKGGQIAFDRTTEIWTSTTRHGHINRLKRSPALQLSDNAYRLRDKIRELPKTRSLEIEIVRGWAFPDCLVRNVEFGPDMPETHVIGGEDLNNVQAAVVRLYGVDQGRKPLAREERRSLINALRPPLQVTQLALMSEIAANEVAIKQLSDIQFQALDMLQHQTRAVIDGCAGSGKTMLALEKARLLAEQGFDVLLTCYNKGLSRWLKRNVAEFPPETRDRIYTAHYHDLAVELCKEAGSPIAFPANPEDLSDFWETEVPNHLMNALDSIERRFDAVIADEGQDFDESWWTSLSYLLHDPEGGVFFIFRDLQQDIYGRDDGVPFSNPPFPLHVNLRNTKDIHALTSTYINGEPKPRAGGPEGRPPEILDVEPEEMVRKLGSVIQRLTVTESIDPRNIVILTPRGAKSSLVQHGTSLAGCRISWSEDLRPNEIRASSIYAFKGLESQIVILVEPEHLAKWNQWRELCYVALSRARHHLIVLGTLPALD
ncbi:MAG: ATP-binding domain-containing protein [Thermomicrobiales bacterium]